MSNSTASGCCLVGFFFQYFEPGKRGRRRQAHFTDSFCEYSVTTTWLQYFPWLFLLYPSSNIGRERERSIVAASEFLFALVRDKVQLRLLTSRFGATLNGLSHRGLLHFGQTAGLSPLVRGNHSWPHLHRHPSSLTIPMSSIIFFATSALREVTQRYITLVITSSKYELYIA